jgi:hypothetical protein
MIMSERVLRKPTHGFAMKTNRLWIVFDAEGIVRPDITNLFVGPACDWVASNPLREQQDSRDQDQRESGVSTAGHKLNLRRGECESRQLRGGIREMESRKASRHLRGSEQRIYLADLRRQRRRQAGI